VVEDDGCMIGPGKRSVDGFLHQKRQMGRADQLPNVMIDATIVTQIMNTLLPNLMNASLEYGEYFIGCNWGLLLQVVSVNIHVGTACHAVCAGAQNSHSYNNNKYTKKLVIFNLWPYSRSKKVLKQAGVVHNIKSQ